MSAAMKVSTRRSGSDWPHASLKISTAGRRSGPWTWISHKAKGPHTSGSTQAGPVGAVVSVPLTLEPKIPVSAPIGMWDFEQSPPHSLGLSPGAGSTTTDDKPAQNMVVPPQRASRSEAGSTTASDAQHTRSNAVGWRGSNIFRALKERRDVGNTKPSPQFCHDGCPMPPPAMLEAEPARPPSNPCRRLEDVMITAAPGKLGVSLDRFSDGSVRVTDVKAGSLLRGQLRVGDKLMSVDEDDVASMRVEEICELLGRRAESERILIVRRVVVVLPHLEALLRDSDGIQLW